MQSKKVIVIGGGAGGMMSAIVAAQKGAQVILFERFKKLGKKLLATGNGRCNLANEGAPVYFGDAQFACQVLQNVPVKEVIDTFHSLGLNTYTDTEGRVYPATMQAQSVFQVLLNALNKHHVQVETEQTVQKIQKTQQGFCLYLQDGRAVYGDRVIVSTGGLAGGNLGCDPTAYQLTLPFGHCVTELSPSLCPVVTEKKNSKNMVGLRVPAIVTLMEGNEGVQSASGEVLFTEYGISGICVMQLARKCNELILKGKTVCMSLDFSPLLNVCARTYQRMDIKEIKDHTPFIRAMLCERAQNLGKKDVLTGLLPQGMVKEFEKIPFEQLPAVLSQYTLKICGMRSFEQAQVTQGGIDTKDVDENTMQSKHTQGLFFTGEVLDVDGDCGGFNLQFAFASGIVAGRACVK